MPTRLGWTFLALLGGIAFAAINTGNNLLYLLVGIGLAALMVSGFAAGRGIAGLALEISHPEEIVARERTSIVLTVRHTGRAGASPALRCTLPIANAQLEPFSLPPVPAGGSLVRFIPALFPRRGRVRLDHVRLQTSDPFGLVTRRRSLAHELEVIVYPSPSDPEAQDGTLGEDSSELISRRVGEGLELHQIRPARSDDDSRHLDWRATARVGELMVKECLEEGAARLTIVFDPWAPAESPVVRGRFEALVSDAAALVWRCADGRTPLRFIAPEREFHDLDPPGGHRPILDYLAQVAPVFDPAGPLVPDLEGEPGVVRLGLRREAAL
jgi:uncharacterized protein (DUF58 family)